LVIAHRGASGEVAEHTLPAYLAAIATGADGLECDVRLTRDGHLVCVHDRTVNRTSNGSGIVSELDLAGLQELDFASWHSELPSSADELVADSSYLADSHPADSPYLAGVAPDRETPGGTTVLTLETLLGVVADAGRPVRLLVETKHPTRYGGLVEKELVRVLQRFGWADPEGTVDVGRRGAEGPAGDGWDCDRRPVTIMSFAPTALRFTLLMDRWTPRRRDGRLPAGVRIGGPGIRLLRADPDYVARAHQAGNRVFCWTVDEPADVELLRQLGVDAIITNRPAAVLAQLEEHRAGS
jgi:glycerophosphoryl diester phosphodiesterase